jgi:hypothetical protein
MSNYFIGHHLPIVQCVIGHLPFWDRVHTVPLICKKWATVALDAETLNRYPLPMKLKQRALWLIKYHLLGQGIYSKLLWGCIPCAASQRFISKWIWDTYELGLEKDKTVCDYVDGLTGSQISHVITQCLLPGISNDENFLTHTTARKQFPQLGHSRTFNQPTYSLVQSQDIVAILCIVRHIFSSVSGQFEAWSQGSFLIPYHVLIQHFIDVLQNEYGIPCILSPRALDHLENCAKREELRLKKRLKHTHTLSPH